MTLKHLFAALLAIVITATKATAQDNYQNYIDTFKGLAIEQMQRHGIPASITLAQGLLESAAGRSKLATEANNHFGIKVTTDWTGAYTLSNDDRPNEKFRKYSTPRESYEDHSAFLKRARYQQLFQLSPTDYRGWANGLQQCGYATNPRYAESLIGIIERYGLQQYDQPTAQTVGLVAQGDFWQTHCVGRCNERYFVIANPGDDMRTLGKHIGKNARRLRRFNDMPRGSQPYAGDVIFTKKKRHEADSAMRGKPHIVRPGESMHTIAQLYGVRLRTLYKLNGLRSDYVPQTGDKIFVN